jgi:hypothetical protein
MPVSQRHQRQRVNKSGCCARFGWTRYEFDQQVAAGMPVIEAAAHRGREWAVDIRAVEDWLLDRQRAARERQRRWQEEQKRREQERARAMAAKYEAERRAEREREARWQAERQACEEAGLLDRAYDICAMLARTDYGYPRGTPMRADEHPQCDADWPRDRPAGWRPPPGMLEAIRAEPAYKPYDYREPDWRQGWPAPYVPGRPWPWWADRAEPAAHTPDRSGSGR